MDVLNTFAKLNRPLIKPTLHNMFKLCKCVKTVYKSTSRLQHLTGCFSLSDTKITNEYAKHLVASNLNRWGKLCSSYMFETHHDLIMILKFIHLICLFLYLFILSFQRPSGITLGGHGHLKENVISIL